MKKVKIVDTKKRSFVTNNSVRIWVGCDKDRTYEPFLFSFAGPTGTNIDHLCRRIYARVSKCPYNDTRIILYETYIAECKGQRRQLHFRNKRPMFVSIDAEPEMSKLF